MRAAVAALAAAVVVACQQPPAPTASPTPAAQTLPPPALRVGPVGSTQRPIVMALAPTRDVARASADGKALAAALARLSGLQWDITVPSSYGTTIEAMCAGESDIAWMTPLATLTARAKNCADPLVAGLRNDPAAGKPSVAYQVQLLVRGGSGITKLSDLKGKRIALVRSAASPTSLALMAQVRKDTSADPKSFFAATIYAGDDEKAVVAVYEGQVDAAAMALDARDAVERTFPDVKQRTQRIATIGPVPNDAFASRKSLPADMRDKVEQALIDHAKTEDGRKALRALYPIDGLDKIDAKLYDPLLEAARLMGIDLDREAAATARPAPAPTK